MGRLHDGKINPLASLPTGSHLYYPIKIIPMRLIEWMPMGMLCKVLLYFVCFFVGGWLFGFLVDKVAVRVVVAFGKEMDEKVLCQF